MARLRDVVKVVRTIGPWTFLRRIYHQVDEDNLWMWAAALAYSWLFAVFPFLIFLLSLLPYLPERYKEPVQFEIRRMLYDTLHPPQVADTIWSNVADILNRPRTGVMGVSLLIALWGASGGMTVTITALETCYEVQRGRPYYIKRPLAVLLTVIVAVLIIVLILLLPVGTIVLLGLRAWLDDFIYGPLLRAWDIARYPIALLLMFVVLNVVYHFGPAIKQRYVFITPGAVFCVAVWMLLGVLFNIYVTRFGDFNQTYGAVAGVAMTLMIFYINALVLLVGAEINSEIDFELLGVMRGSRDFRPRRQPAAPAPAGTMDVDPQAPRT